MTPYRCYLRVKRGEQVAIEDARDAALTALLAGSRGVASPLGAITGAVLDQALLGPALHGAAAVVDRGGQLAYPAAVDGRTHSL